MLSSYLLMHWYYLCSRTLLQCSQLYKYCRCHNVCFFSSSNIQHNSTFICTVPPKNNLNICIKNQGYHGCKIQLVFGPRLMCTKTIHIQIHGWQARFYLWLRRFRLWLGQCVTLIFYLTGNNICNTPTCMDTTSTRRNWYIHYCFLTFYYYFGSYVLLPIVVLLSRD